MNNNLLGIIPKLHKDTKWHQISINEYLLYNSELGTHLIISFEALQVVQSINGTDSVKEITDILMENEADGDDYNNIMKLIFHDFNNNYIIEQIATPEVKKKKLKTDIIILGSKVIQPLCDSLKFLFNSVSVLLVFVLSITLSLFLTITFKIPSESDSPNVLITVAGVIVLLLFHEIGHCTAIYYRNLQSKGIGVGFYFLFPVMFAEVTQAWTLPPRKRMIVNLGGFYLQYIVTSIYYILALLLNNFSFMNLVYFSIMLFLFNLNPFFKSDFYWTLSDFFNIPNFHEEATRKFKKIFGPDKLTLKDSLLIGYTVLRYIFLSIIFLLMFFRLFKSIMTITDRTYNITFWNVQKDILILIGVVLFLIPNKGKKY